MGSKQLNVETVTVEVENVGGIDRSEIELSPGVTALRGRNATNRTSMLRSIMAALGSDRVSLKGDAESGQVTLRIGEETYTRTLTRQNGNVVMDGKPYLENPKAADLFAFLLEDNEARKAVIEGDDLREIIMEPVDTEEIEAEIERLQHERRELDEELDQLDKLKRELPGLEEERTQLQAELEEKEELLEEKQVALEEADASIDDSQEQKAEREEKLQQLQNARSELQDARFEYNSEQESLEALRSEKSELEDELAELPTEPAADQDELEAELDRLRNHKRSLSSTIDQLRQIVQFNRDVLSGDASELEDVLEVENSLTNQLVDDPKITCWTCGSEVDRNAVESTAGMLEDLRQEKVQERKSVSDELEEVKQQLKEIEQKQRTREQLNDRLDDVIAEIEGRQATLEELEQDKQELEESVEQLEAEVEELQDQKHSEVIELHKEVNTLETDVAAIRDDLEHINDEIDRIESELARREELESERSEIAAELEDLRTRIQDLEENAVEQFNEHMQELLDLLEYENLERIWIEKTEQEVREGRRKVMKSVFDMHIVRNTDDGVTYEDTISHLSESEREVIGLVFALSGYLVHEVYNTLPFMLLDSVEAIDSNRIATLVDYFSDHASYFVVSLLPEDAAALSDKHEQLTEI